MRSTSAAVVLVLSSVALLCSTAVTASAATPAHDQVMVQASSFPVGLTGFSSLVVLLGLVGLAVGSTRTVRRSLAAKHAAAQVKPVVVEVEQPVVAEEPARTAA